MFYYQFLALHLAFRYWTLALDEDLIYLAGNQTFFCKHHLTETQIFQCKSLNT